MAKRQILRFGSKFCGALKTAVPTDINGSSSRQELPTVLCVLLRMLWWRCCVERQSTLSTVSFHSTTLACVTSRRRRQQTARRAHEMTSCLMCRWCVRRSAAHNWSMLWEFIDKVHILATFCDLGLGLDRGWAYHSPQGLFIWADAMAQSH